MPLYDFTCDQCGSVAEYLFKYSELPPKMKCNECELGVASYTPTFWDCSPIQTTRRIQNAQRFSPVIIHRDANGNIRFPGNTNAPVPEGFQKVELSTIQQVRALEKEVNTRDSVKAGEFHNARGKFLDGQLKENRRAVDEILAGGTWQGVEDGKIVERRGISPRGQKILAQLREVSMQKQARGRSRVSPEFIVEAFTQDSSNREDHRDASSNWERIRK
jgi:putative FmdB family regulatory protein